jgi:hypothetical protein
MQDRWFEAALICTNGHIINPAATSFPEENTSHCERCGSIAVGACPWCSEPIHGEYHLSGSIAIAPFSPPAFCWACGAPYPWTSARITAAQALAEEMAGLSEREREILKQSISELVHDSPYSAVAVVHFKRLLAKAGKGIAESLREILVDVLSEAAKKAIWG